jgi:ketosteroid isomerase-like protein
MRLKNIAFAMVVAFLPVVASAQFKDLDVAMSNLSRGFGSGDPQAIVAGMADGEQVMLQFPGLVAQSGFFGRDQAAYLLDGLFNKVKPSGFDTKSARKVSAEGQYHIVANWSIHTAAGAETRELYITLRQKDGRWSIASVRSAGK